MRIVNPFAGLVVGANWAWHQANGHQGGTDYVEGPGKTVTAASDGYAYVTIGAQTQVNIRIANGTVITVRELAKATGKFPRNVKLGERIGVTSQKWPHIDATVNNIRVPFEPLITPTVITSSVGPVVKVPTPTPKGVLMVIHYNKRSWLVGEITITEITGHEAEYKALPQQDISTRESFDDLVAAAKDRGVAFAAVVATAVKAATV